MPSSSDHAELARLAGLRTLRGPRDTDNSLGFLSKTFQRQIARPYKQIQALVTLWEQLVPAGLLPHTRLEGLSHGVLRVAVDSSAHLYELDRLLRQGLQRQLIVQHKGPAFRKIQLRVAEGAVGDGSSAGG